MNRNYSFVGLAILALFFGVCLYDLHHRLNNEEENRKAMELAKYTQQIVDKAETQSKNHMDALRELTDAQRTVEADSLEEAATGLTPSLGERFDKDRERLTKAEKAYFHPDEP